MNKRRIYKPKATITIRLPLDVMNYFRAQALSVPPSRRPAVSALIQDCVITYVNGEHEMTKDEIQITDGDYTLTEGSGWFTVKGFAVRIHATDEGVVVDIYQNGKEGEDAIASAYAFDSELEELEK